MLLNLPMEIAGNGGSELPGSSDIGGQLVLALRKMMTEETEVMRPSSFDRLIVPRMDSILKLVNEHVKSARASVEQEWKLRATRRIDQLKHRVNQCFETWTLTENERMLKDPIPTPDPKNMELRFSNKISQPILTGDKIKAEDDTRIEVTLFDSSTGNIVDVGPIACANVEIVALGQGTDDWTVEEFNEKIARVEGKLPLLRVNECRLQGGKGVLENVTFRHHATEVVKPSVFRLGARIVEKFDGIIVKEAKTESFLIKSYRNKYSQKNEIPCLEDNIWVLKNIQRRGKIDERLQAKGIDTVEKFLNQLLINPEELENIVGLRGKKWNATVNHARKCESNRMYCYTNSQETLRVVFDIFGKLQGLHSESQYTETNMLSKNKKVDAENLLSSAFKHWENVTPFDDLDSLKQHLAAIKTSFNPSIPAFQDNILVDQRSSLDHGTISTDFNIGYYVAYAARIDGSGSVSAESEAVVPGCEPPRNWKILFSCISRWFLIRKTLNSEANPARKKQKICSRNTGHPISNPNIEAYEMIDGSNNIKFPNPSFDREILNSDTITFAHCDSFSIHDVGFIDDIPLALDQCSSFDLGTRFADFDIESVVYGARIDGTGSVSAESKAVVPGCEAPRKWKTLFFCVSRWFLIRKMLNSEATPARKKRKICQLY